MECKHMNSKCLDSRPYYEYRRRRYECLDCGKRYSTVEIPMGERLPHGGMYTDAASVVRERFGLTGRQQEAIGELIQAILEPDAE